jgi:hypothetical protein
MAFDIGAGLVLIGIVVAATVLRRGSRSVPQDVVQFEPEAEADAA